MKYISDSEILRWNKRLDSSGYSVYPISNNKSAEPYICFRQKVANTWSGSGDQFINTVDPFIRYDFTFSIASNRIDNFNEIFNKLSKIPFGSKSIYLDSQTQTQTYNEKISDIKLTDDVIESKEESNHKVSDKEYVRYTYHFVGKLSGIMAYIMYLEDAINFLSVIFGYNEDGSEVCLLKFPIGTQVSSLKNKSSDYLVLDYLYKKMDSKYIIDYVASEIINNGGTSITYGEVLNFRESELCYSRNSRIDDILN